MAFPVDDPERRRRIRRTALLFGLIAVAFYVAFIVLSIVRHASTDAPTPTLPRGTGEGREGAS